ncbi:MAG: toxin-antitoxin system YwqK family antitoxin, partial [Bacteroidales bacterium]
MMKKQLLILLALSLTTQLVLAQTLFRDYYDITLRKVKEEYQADGYGNKNGTYKKYSEYGGVLISGTYNSKSEKIGTWIERYTDGKIRKKVTYDKKGRLHGVEVTYLESGEKIYEANWRHGKRHGRVLDIEWITKKKSLHLIEESYYKNDKLDSIYRKWSDYSGELIEESFYKNGVALRREGFLGGSLYWMSLVSTIVGDTIKEYLKCYANGKESGVAYYESEKFRIRGWDDDKASVLVSSKRYYDSGKLESISRFTDDLELKMEYFESGKLKSISRKTDDLKLKKEYYENGKLFDLDSCPTGKECVFIRYTKAGQVERYESPDLNIEGTCYENGNL